MKRAIDKLKFNTIDEVKQYLLSEQTQPISEELSYTIKILLALSQDASNGDVALIQQVQSDLEIQRILLKELAGLFDYPPYPKLNDFAQELGNDYRDLQSYIYAFDKDPVALRAPALNKNQFVRKSTLSILKEQFDINEVKRVVANIRSLTDGSALSAKQQFNLVQQVIYINAIGKDYPLNVGNNSYDNLTAVSRATLRTLSDSLIMQVRNPLLGTQNRLKAQLNLLAVMREQYYRCSGIFLNTTQIMSLLLTINNFQYHQFIDVPSEGDKNSLRVMLAALQWVNTRDGTVSSRVRTDLEIERVRNKSSSDFFTFFGIPSMQMDVVNNVHQVASTPLELIGLGSKSDVNFAYRIPNHIQTQSEDSAGTHINHPEYVLRIKEALGKAKEGQPIILIAKNAAEVVALNDLLKDYLAHDLDEYKVEVFNGAESEKIRLQLLKEKAGKPYHVTITTSSLTSHSELSTEHTDGFLAIQTYIDTPTATRKMIEQLARRNKPVHYTALYEENSTIETLSDHFNSKRGKEELLNALAECYRLRSEETAVEQHYLQAVSTIQQVVLRQFDEWQAFLHLVYPRSEWTTLDSELSAQRKALIDSLKQQWTLCLAASDTEQTYSNPYIRRNTDKKLETGALDRAVSEYERNAEALWSSTRGALKSKTDGKITEDSVNALRCKYLDDIELKQQLKLHKLEVRANKKIVRQEEKRAKRAVESALDIYGALLKYSDDDVTAYRQPFIKSQVKLLANDIRKQINQSSLSARVKSYMVDQVNKADSFHALELVLIEYDQLWLEKDQPTEKYRMQPVINELLRVHQQSGLDADAELQTLKGIYLDNVATDIVQNLEIALSWAKEENRGFLYWIERSAVKEAAHDLLTAVEGVKRSQDPVLRQAAIKNLFKKLTRHQAQLEDLWIFSFGHKNTRDLINQTLATLDDVSVIGSGKDELDMHFINECKEEAQSDLIKQQFRKALKELEALHAPWLQENEQWQAIVNTLGVIQGKNTTLYAIDEMHHFVSTKSNELAQSQSEIFAPLIQLRGTLRTLWGDVGQKHKDLIHESGHFDLKAKQIKEQLRAVDGFDVKTVELRAGSTGFSDYYDLIIKGSGSIPLLDKFTSYTSQVATLNEELQGLLPREELARAQLLKLEQLKINQLPLLRSGSDKIDLSLFSEQHQHKIKEILILKEYAKGKLPVDLSVFPEKMQHAFLDRDLLKSLELKTFTLEQIAGLKDLQVKQELTELYRKVHPESAQPAPSPAWYQRLASYLINPFVPQESEEDLYYQFNVAKDGASNCVAKYLALEISDQTDALNTEIFSMQSKTAHEIQSLNEQVAFLTEKIAEEKKKGGVMVRRFDSVSDLYDFEAELHHYARANPVIVLGDTTENSLYSEDDEEDSLENLEGMKP